jgi:glyoxylase-like metal-dependent hydrolase (beta-lactamase superfamily II)
MRNVPFGRFSISKIADLENALYPPQAIYPDATEVALRTAAKWLGPALVDPQTLHLVLGFNCYVVRTGRHTILVDSCIGNDKERPLRPTWHRRQAPFLDTLKDLGVTPESVDFVLCTHLHADHVGWNTRLVNGAWVPTFPNAQYLIAETEYRHWRALHDSHPPEPILFGAFADSVLPVVESGQAVMVPMDHEVATGVHLEGAPGHTPGNVVIHVEDGGAKAILCGDLMHHPVQVLHPEWSTNFCVDPVASRRSRIDFVGRHADTGARILTGHFPAPTAGQIRRDGTRHVFAFDDAR